ncbi:MAG: LysM peptidoglycan-binding domain-containing protein [Bacteroidales bacterium]|jgi:membrane-bound lytic murein transglycosylase D|nr:LysM peptidoglycan-binding domain-containing protein [Bacteroidales bacterium]
MRKITNIILLTILFTLTYQLSYSQIFKKRASRESLTIQIEQLKRTVDSLKMEIEFSSIPMIDTVDNVNDSINPGGLNFFDSEDFMDPDPSYSTDSLLSVWYLQRSLTLDDGSIIDLEEGILQSDIPDSVYIERLKAINSFIPLPYNNIVKNHIIFYTQRIPNKIDAILGLSGYYMPQFEEIFDQYNLPKELKIMAIIESALNPRAVSSANAKGMWQFMYRTALQYNLRIDSYVDERLDPIASGHAAAKYLKDSYTIFGDWMLAIASYNCGPGNVNKAIRRAGGSRDFWTIYPYLPRETRGYVPSFVAALYTMNYYKEHRITPRFVSMPAHVDTFIINRPLHFGQISELLNIPKEVISDHNPQYINEVIPGNNKGNILRLPYNYTSVFIDNEKDIYTYKDSIFFNPIIYNHSRAVATSQRSSLTHTVKSGETLSHIATRYRVRVADIQAWNGVKTVIRPGQRLVIYTANPPARAQVASSSASTTTSGGYIMYTVKKGDTLWGISQKFNGVSLSDIMTLNGFTKNSKIMPGNRIKIKPA